MLARRSEEIVEGEDRLREVREELPFLMAVELGRELVVEVQPFVGGGGFAEERVVLKGLVRVCGETI
jgi:hypothetical protein